MALAAGEAHSLGLKADGSIVAWGSNLQGQGNVPSPNAGFTAVAAAGWHSLGLRLDGSITAWGANGNGQCNVPAPNADFVAIAAGTYHNVAVKADGTVVAWGANASYQCAPPTPNAGFTAVAASLGTLASMQFSVGLQSSLVSVPAVQPAAVSLLPNRPNPFNPSTTIDFAVPVTGPVRLQVFDLRGRLVRTLVAGTLGAGSHRITWDGRDAEGRELPSAVYVSRLQAHDQVSTGRMTLVR